MSNLHEYDLFTRSLYPSPSPQTFPEEPPVVQLQLLTATVKLFLRKPTEGPQTMIQLVLSNATSETDNPDLRDRAYIYWRLLSTDPEVSGVRSSCDRVATNVSRRVSWSRR